MSVTPDLIREKLIAGIGAIHVVCNLNNNCTVRWSWNQNQLTYRSHFHTISHFNS